MTTKQKILRNENRVYTYFSESKQANVKVFCDYVSYLFLKMCYGKGLTEKQFNLYKEYCCK